MSNNHVIQEILKGNGEQYNIKNLMIAHIKDDYDKRKDDKKFEKFVRDSFSSGKGKIGANRIRSIISLSLILIIVAYLLGSKLIP